MTSNNSKKLGISAPDKHLYTFLLNSSYPSSRSVKSHCTVGRLAYTLFLSPEKKGLAKVKFPLQFCSLLIDSTPTTLPLPEARNLLITLEKGTISYLPVSVRIKLIDPFSQMKRNTLSILLTMQTELSLVKE